jgi:hypothetical protein
MFYLVLRRVFAKCYSIIVLFHDLYRAEKQVEDAIVNIQKSIFQSYGMGAKREVNNVHVHAKNGTFFPFLPSRFCLQRTKGDDMRQSCHNRIVSRLISRQSVERSAVRLPRWFGKMVAKRLYVR